MRSYDWGATGFGDFETDSAGIIIEEYDANDSLLVTHLKVAITNTVDYWRYLTTGSFTTNGNTVKVCFNLDVILSSNWNMGRVTFDDAVLQGTAATSATLTGTVTASDGSPIEGVTVAVQDKSAVTNADGIYVIEQLAPSVQPTSKSGFYSESRTLAALVPGINSLDFTLVTLPASNLLVDPGFEALGQFTRPFSAWTYEAVSNTYHAIGPVADVSTSKKIHNGSNAFAVSAVYPYAGFDPPPFTMLSGRKYISSPEAPTPLPRGCVHTTLPSGVSETTRMTRQV